MTAKTGLLLTHRELRELHELFEPTNISVEDTQFRKRAFRSLFVSDTHIGRHDCKVDRLTMWLDLAQATEVAYFVGDIVDYWLFRASRPHHLGRIFRDDTRFRAGLKLLQYGVHTALRAVRIDVLKPSEAEMMRWSQSHNDPIQKIFRLIRKCRAILLGGNHDELLRGFTNNLYCMGLEAVKVSRGGKPSSELREVYFKSPSLGNLDVVEEMVHETFNGEHLHVCHGDRFDPPVKQSRRLGILATRVFHKGVVPFAKLTGLGQAAAQMTDYVNGMDARQNLAAYYDRYADFLDQENKKIMAHNLLHARGNPRSFLHGGIHGHIHNPGIRWHRGYVFMDIGDFVQDDHCTSVVEHTDGTWQILTVDRERGIYPHPSTPNPIDLWANRDSRASSTAIGTE
jgi:UDP-2,3-diacylglucosamine pyrophosphatase LpxH